MSIRYDIDISQIILLILIQILTVHNWLKCKKSSRPKTKTSYIFINVNTLNKPISIFVKTLTYFGTNSILI